MVIITPFILFNLLTKLYNNFKINLVFEMLLIQKN